MSSCASCLILGPSEYHRRLAAPEGASSSSHLVRRASFSFSEILIGVFSSDRAASLTKDRSDRILNTELLRGGGDMNVTVAIRLEDAISMLKWMSPSYLTYPAL